MHTDLKALAQSLAPLGLLNKRIADMDKKEITALYREMRRKFDALDRFNVSILSGVQGFETLYGKRADKQRKLSNGGMRCRLYQYLGRNGK